MWVLKQATNVPPYQQYSRIYQVGTHLKATSFYRVVYTHLKATLYFRCYYKLLEILGVFLRKDGQKKK
jgi:hypothetical protein